MEEAIRQGALMMLPVTITTGTLSLMIEGFAPPVLAECFDG